MNSFCIPTIVGESGYDEILAALEPAADGEPAGSKLGRFGDVTISSHFQPIFSLSHRRIVGHEALMRGRGPAETPVSPLELLNQANRDYPTLLHLDRLARATHLHNFAAQPEADGWLFINMSPEVFLNGPNLKADALVSALLRDTGLAPQRLVIEVLEEAVQDNTRFIEAVDFFRSLGFLIALDDFGAGHSNFDRVWSIRPEIVKLDRSIIVQAAADPKIRRTLPQIVSLLHEAGAMVLMEGVETADEAYIALESDVDFVQGYYFGRPGPRVTTDTTAGVAVNDLWSAFDARWLRDKRNYHENIAPYFNALGYASVLLSAGRSLEEACASFLELENSAFSYLLDAQGQQIGVNLWSADTTPNRDRRFGPLADTRGARWARRPYFRRAVENFGKVQVTRPYLSLSSASLCVTLSCSFKVNGELRVICGDVRWEQH
ncbi:MAG TPA: EAL domain-containing protein [Azospira sp.]|nr:EAL domain-containing protein [Azospira sp.]